MDLIAVGKESECTPVRFDLSSTESDGVATARLRCLPGATGIFVEMFEGETLLARAEVAAQPDDELTVTFRRLASGRMVVACPGRRVVHLSTDVRDAPPQIHPPWNEDGPIDLVWVVDGTMCAVEAETSLLLADQDEWWRLSDTAVALTEVLIGGKEECRVTAFAFADDAMPQAKAPDLLPAYRFHPAPEGLSFEPFDLAHLTQRLRALPPSSGGDFVDDLAGALRLCRRLPWRESVRRVAIVLGDSPGFSLHHPAPAGADGQGRADDVDKEARRLHDQGIALATIYHRPSEDDVAAALAVERGLLDFAEAQYRRLASRPEWAFDTTSVDPAAAAGSIRDTRGRLARGTTWGEWIS